MLFGLAIASWRFAQHHPDDAGRFLGILAAMACVVSGLAIAPMPMQGAILAGLLFYPICSSKNKRLVQPHCPRFCLLRDRCQPSKERQT